MDSAESWVGRFPNGVRLREDAQVWEDEKGLRIAARRSMTIVNPRPQDRVLLELLRDGIPANRLKEMSTESRVLRMVESLSWIGGLRHAGQDHATEARLERQSDWLSYSLADPGAAQERIAHARILILGCGGIGAVIAQHLARSGFRHFALVDAARVDAPDLNRQLPYSARSIGKEKASALARFLIDHEDALSAKGHLLQIDSSGAVSQVILDTKPDFIVAAMDHPIGRISPWIAEAAGAAGVPVLFGGVGIEDATIGPLLDTPDACRAYASAMANAGEKLRITGRIPKGSIVFTNTLAATQLAFDVFRYFAANEPPLALNRTLNLSFPALALSERASWPS